MEPAPTPGELSHLLLTTGRSGGEALPSAWWRANEGLGFWRRPQTRQAVELGLALFTGGMAVTGADWLARSFDHWTLATWLNDQGSPLVVIASVATLGALRWLSTPLRLRRARAACFTSGIVVEVPDLLGLATGGGGQVGGLGWDLIARYRDAADHVALYRERGWLPALRVPTHDEAQRVGLLALLDEHGIPRAE